ncbi:MAG TPA: LytTR family DNA-binding domain-containing protein [Chitinophagaceae bacterium]|jgi:two-component system LytT family response regulator|nr:LytTR family DNA-binding domain-containing protein [Chitinophagaceae bacterium]
MLKAILIDDEASSLNSLRQKILQHCPEVMVIAVCDDPQQGLEAVNTLEPDLVFLDIEMPVINGFTLLQKLSFKNFELIFVTAYDHYAIKAIRFSALDYLVKPVEIEYLANAVARAVEKRNKTVPNNRLELLLENITAEKTKFRRIAIPTTEGIQFVKVEDLMYLEASVNYTKFHLQNNIRYTVSKTLKEFEDMLTDGTFLRIHNSYIVNKNFVEKYIRGEGGQVILSDGTMLDVSKRKKAEFLKAIGF